MKNKWTFILYLFLLILCKTKKKLNFTTSKSYLNCLFQKHTSFKYKLSILLKQKYSKVIKIGATSEYDFHILTALIQKLFLCEQNLNPPIAYRI